MKLGTWGLGEKWAGRVPLFFGLLGNGPEGGKDGGGGLWFPVGL